MICSKLTRIMFVLVMSVGIIFPELSWSNVATKNGDFFIGFADYVAPGGADTKVERVYNSKTDYKGIFGNGWGTEYDVYIETAPDGSLIVHEYGGGAQNRFYPANYNTGARNNTANMIAGIARSLGMGGDSAYIEKLKTDAFFRDQEYRKFIRMGKIKPIQVANGIQFTSERFGNQTVTKVSGGYVRNFSSSGRQETFKESSTFAKLTLIRDKNGNFIKLFYTTDGKLDYLEDSSYRRVYFKLNDRGLVTQLDVKNGKHAYYKYNNKDQLTYTKDVDENTYEMKYDDHNNLTEIRYSDHTTMVINYYGQSQHENVKSVKERDGSMTEYAYRIDPKNQNHYTVSTVIKGADGKKVTETIYEYTMKVRPSGEIWTAELAITENGVKTDTMYDENCDLPVKIIEGARWASFQYDGKCRVKLKKTPSETTTIAYDGLSGKVGETIRYAEPGHKVREWVSIKYDRKGNLRLAKDSQGHAMELLYDGRGRMNTMIDKNHHRIEFKYNEDSQPVEIKDPQIGKISPDYDNNGKLKTVGDGPGQRKVAAEVETDFEDLLEMTKEAGVDLTLEASDRFR